MRARKNLGCALERTYSSCLISWSPLEEAVKSI
jgi:hypothetical protein